MPAFKALRAQTPEDKEADWDEEPTTPCAPLIKPVPLEEVDCVACEKFSDCRNVADTGENPIWCCLTCDPRDAAQIHWELERDRQWPKENEQALESWNDIATDPFLYN